MASHPVPMNFLDQQQMYYPNNEPSPMVQPNQMNMGHQAPNVQGLPAFPGVLNKADLRFEGNLEEIMFNWNDPERTSSRRLVQFWRRHENNTIFSRFRAIQPAEKEPDSIIISCIYWDVKDQYYVTSVDCIFLLEALISVRFTVEEKNRIRRNLEGFRPLTISKCRAETSDFFKLIMAFPNPKPRNIEKDVKVFPWKILPYALRKIVSKYAAGYTPSFGLGMNNFGGPMSNMSSGLSSPASSYSMGFNPQYNMGNVPARVNMQRRFSQPINSINMAQFQHPYKMNVSDRRMSSSLIGNNNLSVNYKIQEEDESELDNRPNLQSLPPVPMNTVPQANNANSISALSLETTYNQPQYSTDMEQRLNTNFDHDFIAPNPIVNHPMRQVLNARRHSLADPYSLQRFQAIKFGIGPFAINQSNGTNSPFDFNQTSGLNSINEDNSFNTNHDNSYNIAGNGDMMMVDQSNVMNYSQMAHNTQPFTQNNVNKQPQFDNYDSSNHASMGYNHQNFNQNIGYVQPNHPQYNLTSPTDPSQVNQAFSS